MGVLQLLHLLLTHPQEFATLAQFYLYHHHKSRDITNPKEYKTTGYDRESMRKCWDFLDKTSRSYSMVIKQFDGELARTICLFYLVLRGLDTIEDDMTLSDEIKQPILRTFHLKLSVEGWTFDGCGPGEKDRQLLVEFDNVVKELNLLDPKCREIITDITHKMETGMADFAHRAALASCTKPPSSPYLLTISEYDLYCHYVAGLVGEGLSRLFSATGKEQPWIADQLVLSNSMGLLLQKTNILRDFREDCEEGRYFWPREIWGRYGFGKPEEMYNKEGEGKLDDNVEERALWALSEMTLNALSHSVDTLDYLVLLRNQSVFNSCAIPVSMAIATLELCFMNPAVFQRNIKIRRAEAVRLIMKSTNPRDVAHIFRFYSRKIHQKASPADPNYLGICAMWGKIETWVEHHYPSFVSFSPGSLGAGGGEGKVQYSKSDPRSRIVDRYRDLQLVEARRARGEDVTLADISDMKGRGVERGESRSIPWQLYAFVGGMTVFLFVVAGMSVWGMLYFVYGERWTWDDVRVAVEGNLEEAMGKFALVQGGARARDMM